MKLTSCSQAVWGDRNSLVSTVCTCAIFPRKTWNTSMFGNCQWNQYDCIDLIRETISYYVIHFQMAKAHECPLAALHTAVSGEAWKAVALGSFDSPRPRTWWCCRKKLLNDRNGRRQLIVVLVKSVHCCYYLRLLQLVKAFGWFIYW